MMRTILASALGFWALSFAAPVFANGIVYIGTDASVHDTSHVEGYALLGNAARWAGGGVNPNIAYVNSDGGFGGNLPGAFANQGLTNVTPFTPAGLAIANLSSFDEIVIGATTNASGLVSASANVAAFVAAGGGLVVEAEVNDANSWSWLPYGNLIGSSGAANVGHDSVAIVDPLHPVMTGLTDAGLSNWGFTVHSTFSTPGAAGFTTLAVDSTGSVPYIIAKAIPEPSTVVLLTMGSLMALVAHWRKP